MISKWKFQTSYKSRVVHSPSEGGRYSLAMCKLPRLFLESECVLNENFSWRNWPFSIVAWAPSSAANKTRYSLAANSGNETENGSERERSHPGHGTRKAEKC